MHITDAGFTFVGQLGSLIFLILNNTFIADDGVKAIAFGCCNLIHMLLNLCKNITDAGFAAIGRLGYLTRLEITGTLIADEGLSAITFECRNLSFLDLSNCGHITDAGFAAVSRLVSLSYLYLCNTMITGDGLKAIASGCCNLSHVNVDGCKYITNAGLATAIGHLQSLTYLEMNSINDATVMAIVSGCAKLNFIKMSDGDITESEISTIRQALQEKCVNQPPR